MQYFIGYTEFRSDQPFAPSLMVAFRKWIDMVEIQRTISEHPAASRKAIVRGKASAEVEFEAKVAASRVNGCFRSETRNWDNFNESTELIQVIAMQFPLLNLDNRVRVFKCYLIRCFRAALWWLFLPLDNGHCLILYGC